MSLFVKVYICEQGKSAFVNVLIGGHKLPEERVKHLTVLWTGFLEEANFRGLDLKNIRFKA